MNAIFFWAERLFVLVRAADVSGAERRRRRKRPDDEPDVPCAWGRADEPLEPRGLR